MTARRATYGILALLLALLIAASGVLAHPGAAKYGSGQQDLLSQDAVMTTATPHGRTPLPAPDGADDPGVAASTCELLSAQDVVTATLPRATAIRIHQAYLPPSRGPPAAAL